MLFLTICTALGSPVQTVTFQANDFMQGSGRSVDDSPRHSVSLSTYKIDQYEVSIKQFEEFVKTAWSNEQFWHSDSKEWRFKNPDGAGSDNRRADRPLNHPVVAVSWYEADAYCHWKGGQLPTEAQWENAACPDAGIFPWGSAEDVNAVWYSGGKYGHLQTVLTKAVDDSPAAQRTEEGLTHTVGNVWEWTSDWYHKDSYKSSDNLDPKGPDTGLWKTLRGGSYMNLPSYCGCTHREPASPDRVSYTVGFRCAYDVQ